MYIYIYSNSLYSVIYIVNIYCTAHLSPSLDISISFLSIYVYKFNSFSLSLSVFVCTYIGDSDISQLTKIFTFLGTPSDTTWPGVSSLPNYVHFEPCESSLPQFPINTIFQQMVHQPQWKPTGTIQIQQIKSINNHITNICGCDTPLGKMLHQ